MIRNVFALVAAVLSLNAFAAVDINRADRAELETVKGVGPGLSARIVKAREAGAFKDWPDLIERVGGIGPGNAARLSQAGATVGGRGFDAQAVPVKPAGRADGAADASAAKAGRKPAVPTMPGKADRTDRAGKQG